MELQEQQFIEITRLIQESRNRAYKNINKELIKLYWNVGEYISQKVESAEWGMGVVDNLAQFIQDKHPDIKGFTRRGLYRMKQFYETYKDYPDLIPLLVSLSWTNNLIIFSKTKTPEEREFYLRLAIKEGYTKRELERQVSSSVFERSIASGKIVSPVVAQTYPDLIQTVRDTYLLDFLDLPEGYSEKDLQKAIVNNLKKFILEVGKDFAFIGEEYRVQVGNNDYFIDLLFFHRGLSALVAFELKIDEFKPEYLGKINFYLEALDREIKKPHENPSVGIILCKSKDDEVVRFAMNRNISPALVAEYETKLIDKKLLQQKLRDLFLLTEKDGNL